MDQIIFHTNLKYIIAGLTREQKGLLLEMLLDCATGAAGGAADMGAGAVTGASLSAVDETVANISRYIMLLQQDMAAKRQRMRDIGAKGGAARRRNVNGRGNAGSSGDDGAADDMPDLFATAENATVANTAEDVAEKTAEKTAEKAAVSGNGTAAAGGGIPWLTSLSRATRLDEITVVGGILNGTTNYMLSAMTASGVDYTTCLREAQALGYAEADPTADVEGYDARRKLVLSANLAFGASVQEEEIPCFGISSVEKKDFAAWRELGRVCKLFVRAERHEGRISAFVCPTLFPAASPVAQTNGTGNLVTLRGARFGELSFSGAGAGGYPTGSSVLSDCVDVIEGCPSFYVSRHEAKHIDNSAAVGRFYLRTGSETVCTGPITVAEAFARAERARSCGEPVFLARIEEE